MIANLTPEQITQIPIYREKWRDRGLSTERIDRDLAAEAVKNLYEIRELKLPAIAWFDSPYAALSTIAPILEKQLTNPIGKQLKNELGDRLVKQLKTQIESKHYRELLNQFKIQLEKRLKNQFQQPIKKELAERLRTEFTSQFGEQVKGKYKPIIDLIASESITPESLACWGSLFDFARTELKCDLDEKKSFALESAVKSCGWIFAFKNTVIICDRPTQILFNDKGFLHAEAEPAISFPDEYKIYAHRGVILPVQYGMLPTTKWRAKWLLKNHPPELKRVIMQAIGKPRLRQELTEEELKNVLQEQTEYLKQKEAKKQELQKSLSDTGIRELAKNNIQRLTIKDKKQANLIKYLTHEQEKRIKKFDKKWQILAFNKRRKKSESEIEKVIKNASKFVPEDTFGLTVTFCDNPAESLRQVISDEVLVETLKKVVRYLRSKSQHQLRVDAVSHLNHTDLMASLDSLTETLGDDVKSYVNRMLNSQVIYSPLAKLGDRLEREINSQIDPRLKEKFFKSLPGINHKLQTNLDRKIYHPFIKQVTEKLLAGINSKLGEDLERRLGTTVRSLLVSKLIDSWSQQLEKKLYSEFPDLGKYYQLGAWLDFCISVLGCECDAKAWSAFEELAANCSWIYARGNVCAVSLVSLSYKVKEREATIKIASDKKPPMPLWQKAIVFSFWATVGLPLFVLSRLLDLINLGIRYFKLLGKLLGFLIFPLEFFTRFSWLFIEILTRLEVIVSSPFVWVLNSFFNNRSNNAFLQEDTILDRWAKNDQLFLEEFEKELPQIDTLIKLFENQQKLQEELIEEFQERREFFEEEEIRNITQWGWTADEELPLELLADGRVRRTTRTRTEFDSEGRIHAEGKPAIVHFNGFKEYYHHGVRLLDRRYRVHPSQWQASWLLTERDPEHFNVLIEEIGYARACVELSTRELNSWREYSLLEFVELIDPNDRLHVRVLKMTCPSTGSVHAVRVPPDTTSARYAIGWVNWGTDPEEFVVET